MNQLQEFLTATKAFLALKPSLENIKAFMSLSDMQINLQFDLSAVNITKPRSIAVDVSAALFLPEEHKHLVCGVATGDGACLFNSVSLFLAANESLSLILRAATVHELLSYPEFYLHIPVFMTDWPWSNIALDALLAVYGLASAISRPINSIYPAIRGNGRAPYHQLILPRQINHFQPPVHTVKKRRSLILNDTVSIITAADRPNKSTYVGTLMAGLAPVKELEVKIEAGEKIRYKSLDDITIALEQEEAANLITTDHYWQDSYTSHYWLRQIIRCKGLFPQIDIHFFENRRCCIHHAGAYYGQVRGLSAEQHHRPRVS